MTDAPLAAAIAAPILPDALTVPRRAPQAEDGRVNLVGLTRNRPARRARGRWDS